MLKASNKLMMSVSWSWYHEPVGVSGTEAMKAIKQVLHLVTERDVRVPRKEKNVILEGMASLENGMWHKSLACNISFLDNYRRTYSRNVCHRSPTSSSAFCNSLFFETDTFE